MIFKLHKNFVPSVEQRRVVSEITHSFTYNKEIILEGVTGSGKTYTMAQIIEVMQLPTMIILPNKTLCNQIYRNMLLFFPSNNVKLFLSHFKYYRPEAFIPHSEKYIEKTSSIDRKIEKIRINTTLSLLNNKDNIIVTTVACIYGIGLEDYGRTTISLEDDRTHLIEMIKVDMIRETQAFNQKQQYLLASRLENRIKHDIEAIKELGFCKNMEKYSMYLNQLKNLKNNVANTYQQTLLTLFAELNKKHLIILDESHITVPQLKAMAQAVIKRNSTLIQFGFNLSTSLYNRPLLFEEFMKVTDKILYVSATPGTYEYTKGYPKVEQIIRPTGISDPRIEIRAIYDQVNNLVQEILILKKKKQASIISVLTKQNSEDLATLLIKKGIKAAHLHCEMGAEERTKVIDDLQSAKLDVVVGINLLREGLDIPRTSTVFILDGDKKGFLRSFVSLTQLIGRAARHIDGRAIIYADEITIHIQRVLEVSTKRRRIQQKQQFN